MMLLKLLTDPATWLSFGSIFLFLRRKNVTARLSFEPSKFSMELSWSKKPFSSVEGGVNSIQEEVQEALPPAKAQ